jgi:hypothetical protein
MVAMKTWLIPPRVLVRSPLPSLTTQVSLRFAAMKPKKLPVSLAHWQPRNQCLQFAGILAEKWE